MRGIKTEIYRLTSTSNTSLAAIAGNSANSFTPVAGRFVIIPPGFISAETEILPDGAAASLDVRLNDNVVYTGDADGELSKVVLPNFPPIPGCIHSQETKIRFEAGTGTLEVRIYLPDA